MINRKKPYDFLKLIAVFSAVMLLHFSSKGQKLYVGSGTGQIHLVDLKTCKDSIVVASTPVMYDVAMCPDSPNLMYGLSTPPTSPAIYVTDLKTGITTTISSTFPAGHVPTCLNSLVCDGKGHLYAADAYSSEFFEFDIATATWIFLGNMGGYESGGDLTYFNGQLYLSTTTSQIVAINISPFSATLVSQMSISNVWGINTVSITSKCSGLYKMVACSGSDIYYVDPVTGVCTPACMGLVPGGIYGATSVPDSIPYNIAPVVAPPVTPVCAGINVTMKVNSGHLYKYSWDPNGSTDSVLTVPASNTTYTVTGTDARGCTSTATVEVIANPKPTALPTSTPGKCGFSNGSVTANASGNNPIGLLWSPGGATTNSVSNLSAGTYSVSLTDKNGCTNTASVVVAQQPPLTLGISPDVTVCAGQNASAFATANGSSPYTYSWTNATNGSSITVSPATTTTYTVSVIDANGCTSSQSVTVNVNPIPVAEFNSGNVCAGGITKFTDASTISSGTVKDSVWDFGDGSPASTAANPTHTYTVNTYTVTLWVTSNSGCKDSAKHVVTVYPSPVPKFTAIEVCKGATTTFTDQSTGTISTYSWNFGDVPAGTAATQNPTYVYAAPGTYTVTLVTTSNFNCTATSTTLAIVDPFPKAKFITSPLCEGAATTFSDQSSITRGTIAGWKWNLGDVPVATSTVQNPSHTYKAGSYAVWLTVISDKGCKDSIKDSAIVHPLPVADFGTPAKGCAPVCIDFSDKSTVAAPDKIKTWVWDFGEGTTSTLQHPTHCYSTPGVYNANLTVVTNNDCSASKKVDSIAVVYNKPTADFNADPGTVGVLAPTINFTDASQGAPVSWHWDFGVTPKDTANTANTSFTYPNDVNTFTTYNVTLHIVNQYGCPDSITKPVHVIPDWTFYVPNTFTPNGDGVNDLFYGTGTGILEKEMWIFDRWGNEIFHTNDLYGGWDGRVQGGSSNEIAQIDTYVWLIRIKEVLGNYHRYIGHVNIVR